MINAEETKKLALEAISEKSQAQMEEVEELILAAARNGSFSCYIEGSVLPIVATCLKEMGYSVRSNTARNECWTTISWSELSC